MTLKIGTLVKFKSGDELAKIPYTYTKTQVNLYADQIAIIIGERSGDYEVYFPHYGMTHAWCYEEEFDVIEDLLKDYR